MPKADQEIIIDKEKTFSCMTNSVYRLPDRLQVELMKTARRLAESGKDTLLVRTGTGMEKMLIDSFISLRGEYPDLRLIRVTYQESLLGKELADVADGAITLKLRQRVKEFMLENSSAIVCYMTQSDYGKSRLRKYYEKEHCLEVINLYRPTINGEMEQELYRLVGSDEYTPREIAERLLDWKPCVPSRLSRTANEFKTVLNILCSEYSDDPAKMKELTAKTLSAMFYYSYIMGCKDSEIEKI